MHPLLWVGYEIEIVDRDFSRLDSTVRNYALSEFFTAAMHKSHIFSRVPTTCIEIPCFVYIICVMCIDFSCFFAYPAGYSYFVIVFAVF